MKKSIIISFLIVPLLLFYGCKKEEPATKPSLSTTPTSNITTTSAISGGVIADDGGASITANGVCWGKTENPTIEGSKTNESVGTGQFVSNLTGLDAGTTYHVRAYATNPVGTSYGADMTFLTLGQAPSGLTQPPSNVTAVTATLNATVNPNDLSTTVTFEYGLTTSYGSTAAASPSPVTGNTMVNVMAEISGLLPATTYHYRVKTVNSIGTTYSEDKTFTTAGIPPAATTSAATSKSTTGATLNGTVNANNTSTTVTFEYGATTSYGQTATATPSPITDMTNTDISASITGLTAGTTYHFRVKAVNSVGTTYGSDMTFTTEGLAPTATTLDATNKTSTGATLNASVNANMASTTVTFEYGTTTSYGQTVTASQSPVTGSSNTNVSAGISGLMANTNYHFRIKAVNSVGTTYGTDMIFTTLYPPPPTSGLVAYFPFNGNANDESGTGNNLTNNGAIPFVNDRFGINGKSASFNGTSQYFSKVSPSLPSGNSSSTLSLWFICDSYDAWRTIFGYGDNTPEGSCYSEYHLATADVTPRFNHGFIFNGRCNDIEVVNPYPLNNWNHLLLTWENTTLTFYLNGNVIDTRTLHQFNLVLNLLVIGGGLPPQSSEVRFFHGLIDDIRFYNRVLSNPEIQQLYHEGGW